MYDHLQYCLHISQAERLTVRTEKVARVPDKQKSGTKEDLQKRAKLFHSASKAGTSPSPVIQRRMNDFADRPLYREEKLEFDNLLALAFGICKHSVRCNRKSFRNGCNNAKEAVDKNLQELKDRTF